MAQIAGIIFLLMVVFSLSYSTPETSNSQQHKQQQIDKIEKNDNRSKILSRKKRFLIFPTGM